MSQQDDLVLDGKCGNLHGEKYLPWMKVCWHYHLTSPLWSHFCCCGWFHPGRGRGERKREYVLVRFILARRDVTEGRIQKNMSQRNIYTRNKYLQRGF